MINCATKKSRDKRTTKRLLKMKKSSKCWLKKNKKSKSKKSKQKKWNVSARKQNEKMLKQCNNGGMSKEIAVKNVKEKQNSDKR
jgi:hypothetical protein